MRLVILVLVAITLYGQSKTDLRAQLTAAQTELSRKELLHAQEQKTASAATASLARSAAQLQKQVNDLTARVSRADAIAAERDELRTQLQLANRNLAAVTAFQNKVITAKAIAVDTQAVVTAKELPKFERKLDAHQVINTAALERNAVLTQRTAQSTQAAIIALRDTVAVLAGRVKVVETTVTDHSGALRRQEVKDDRFWYGLLFMIGLLVLTIGTGAYLLRYHGAK